MIQQATQEMRQHLNRAKSRDYKIITGYGIENHFFLRNSKLQVNVCLEDNGRLLEIEILDLLSSALTSYRFKKPITLKDLVLAQHDAMKNFHTSRLQEKNLTWAKYKKPNK